MLKFYMAVGLPGSGKSSYKIENAVHISSDNIRKKLYGDESVQRNPKRVFTEMWKNTVDALAAGKNVYYDATNLNAYRRKSLLLALKEKFEVECRCVIFDTPIEICIARDAARSRTVGAEVINKMNSRFEFPSEDEGWDRLYLINTVDE